MTIELNAQGDVTVGGDVVGRDKIVNNIQHIVQRALTMAEEAAQEQALEMQRLAQGVSAFAQRLQARASDTTDTARGSPYKGLLEYRLSDSENFFGRRQAIAGVLENLARGPLTVVHSESGAGKTSLLQAGVSPRLIAAGHLPVYIRPYNIDPALALKRAFISDPGRTPLLATAPLRDFLRQVSGVIGAGSTLYIFLDQFEEFFTQLEEAARADFIRELAECLDDEGLNVRWALALRTEHFGNLANFRPRIRNPFENDFRLNRLTRTEAQEVVTEPAKRRGVTFEDGLVDILLDDLGKTEIAPPQIQLVCSALYEELKEGEAVITRATYEAEGGAAGILRSHLERVLSRELQPAERQAARRLLESLISSEQQRILRTHTELVAELTARGVTAETLDTILNQLIDSRLIRVHEGGPDGTELTYELAHDYLLGEIRLDPDVQARKAAQELLEQEVRAYRRYQTLLSPDRLRVIEGYKAELRFTPEAEQLFNASEAAAEALRMEAEARRQKELDDARALAEAQRLKAESEKLRADEQAHSAQRLSARNRIITGVGIMAGGLAVIALILFVTANAARQEADKQRDLANAASTQAIAQQAAAEAASTEAIRQQGLAGTQAAVRGTAESVAVTERNAAISRQLAAQAANYLTTRADLSLLFSLEAYRTFPSLEAQSSLLAGLAANPQLSTFLRGHPARVRSIAYSADGGTLVAGSSDGTLTVWDTSTRPPILKTTFTISHGSLTPIVGMALSADGELLALGGPPSPVEAVSPDLGWVEVWEVASQSLMDSFRATEFDALAFNPDKTLLAVAGRNRTIQLRDLKTQTSTFTLQRHEQPVNQVAFSADGGWLASTSGDGSVVIWEVATGRALWEQIFYDVTAEVVGDAPPTQSIAFSPDGNYLAMGDNAGRLYILNAAGLDSDSPLLASNYDHVGAVIQQLAFSADSLQLVSADSLGNIRLWRLGDLLNSPRPNYLQFTGLAVPVTSLAFNPDGKQLISGHEDGSLTLWQTDSLSALSHGLAGHEETVSAIAFNPQSGVLASGGYDGSVRLWDVEAFQPLDPLLINGGLAVFSLAFDPAGRWLAMGGSEGTMQLADLNIGQFTSGDRLDHEFGVVALAFSPDGKLLAGGSCAQADAGGCVQHNLYLWSITDDGLTEEPMVVNSPGAQVNSLAFSPDGKWLAEANTELILRPGNPPVQAPTIQLWNLSDPGSPALGPELTGNSTGGVFSVAFSPDGKTLLAGNGNGTLTLWDISTQQTIGLPLTGHTGKVAAVAFSPAERGQMLASGSADGTVVLWDAAARRALGLPLQLQSAVTSLSFSPDGTQLAVGRAILSFSDESAVTVWDIGPAAWQAAACQIAGRNFTQAEWAQYFPDQPYRETCV